MSLASLGLPSFGENLHAANEAIATTAIRTANLDFTDPQ